MKKVIWAVVAVVVVAAVGVGLYFATRPSEEQVKKMYWAVREGDLDKINALIAEDQQLARSSHADHTMLGTAACTYSPIPNQTEVCRILLENGADPNANSGEALHGAVYCWNTDLIRLLLKHGADPHIKPRETDGRTPYEHAKWREMNDVVKIFDEHGK